MSLTMSVSGADHRIRFDWEEAAAAWGQRAAPTGLSLLRLHAPFRTGALRQNIARRYESTPGRFWVVYFATVPQAAFTIRGTRAHPIPRTPLPPGRALRWMGPGGVGGPYYAKRVNHPGTKPDPWPERALEGKGEFFAGLFADAAREAML